MALVMNVSTFCICACRVCGTVDSLCIETAITVYDLAMATEKPFEHRDISRTQVHGCVLIGEDDLTSMRPGAQLFCRRVDGGELGKCGDWQDAESYWDSKIAQAEAS
jgi:hypothetical protein